MSYLTSFRAVLACALLALSLSGCGFHLRRSAKLPPQMAHVHLAVNGGNLNFRRSLERNLRLSGAVLEEASGPGIAELKVPVAQFTNDSLSLGGYVEITEYAVHFIAVVELDDDKGNVLMGRQRIDLEQEYSTDAYNNVGNSSQVDQLQAAMSDEMVESIMRRLEATANHPAAARPDDPSAVAPEPVDSELPGTQPLN